MTSESTRSLRSFVSLVRGTTYKGGLVGQPGPVLLGLASIQPDGGFRRGAFKTYGGESPAKITLGPGDIYVSLKDVTQSGDLLGSVARVPSDILAGRLTQDTVKLQFDGHHISQDYVYWLLRTPAYRAYCRSHATGTTTLGLARDDFLDFPVVEPGDEDLSLVELLEALDDRIALLLETNANLEAIAQALFKSWFVDFDPVRAKCQDLAPAGIVESTAALFPGGLEESVLGPVPKGWPCIDLGELTRRCGGAIQTGPFGSQLHAKDYVDNGVPVVMPKDIVGRRVSTESIARVGSDDVERLSRHKLQAGDIVFSRRGDVERHALITEREVGWLCGTGCLLVRPGPAWQSPGFLSLLLDAPRARTWLVQHAVGATMPNLNTGILSSVPVVLPPPPLLAKFDAVVAVTEEQRSRNATMAETLADIRDALLPRLISGQLRLPALEDTLAT